MEIMFYNGRCNRVILANKYAEVLCSPGDDGLGRSMRAYYEVAFKAAYLEKRGNAFQDFFSEIMEKCHPSDFQRVRPWGRDGDKKNDGRLRSGVQYFRYMPPTK